MNGDDSTAYAPTTTDQGGRAGSWVDDTDLSNIRPEIPLRDMPLLRRAEAIVRWGFRHAGNSAGRRTMIRRAAFGLLRSGTPVVAAEIAGERYLVSTHDRAIGAITFSEGGLDLHLMEYALELVESLRGYALRGRTFVDVGANIGTATIPALARFGAIGATAIEPAPENFKLLRCNIIMNGFSDKVVAIDAALSDTIGTGLLELGETNWGDHRLRSTGSGAPALYGEAARDLDEVRIITFDSLVHAGVVDLATLGLVWVDTQGHEAQVLAGAQSLLDSNVPVVIEYWPYGLRRADGLEQLHRIIEERYRAVVDLRASASHDRQVTLPASAVEQLEKLYTGTSYTDLLLLK